MWLKGNGSVSELWIATTSPVLFSAHNTVEVRAKTVTIREPERRLVSVSIKDHHSNERCFSTNEAPRESARLDSTVQELGDCAADVLDDWDVMSKEVDVHVLEPLARK